VSLRKEKKPVVGATVEARKQPKRAVVGAPLSEKPTVIWGLSYVDLEGPWGWSRIAVSALDRVLKFMHNLEGMRPTEIFGTKSKHIALDSLCPQAQQRLEAIELDDLDGLWELRVSGRERIWGHRQKSVFYPVWWDPRHEVCPSKKKHT
jgi:hypothetical protein